MKRLIPGFAAFALLFGRGGSASADLITIANSSFEEPSLPDGTFNVSIQDWTQGGGSSIGTWDPDGTSFDLSTLDGNQNAYLNGGQIAQQLTTGLVLGQTYRLSALFGTIYTLGFEKGGVLELWAGGTVTGGDVIGGALLGTLTVTDTALVNGKFVQFQTEILAPSFGPIGGELLSIRFVSNGRESEIDNIQLSTASAIPEPPTLAMMTTMLVMLAAVELWKR